MRNHKIGIAPRFDEPSPCSNQELEKRMLSILDKLVIPITIAVIPFCSGSDTLTPVSRASVPHLVKAYGEGRIDITQHGHNQACLSSTPKGDLSEFWGLPAEFQQQHTDAGQVTLQAAFGRPIVGYIPPKMSMITPTPNTWHNAAIPISPAAWRHRRKAGIG